MSAAQKRVFIIDDSETVRKNLTGILTRGGYQVFDVSDGSQGLKRLSQERFDVLLLDIEMPGLNGFELLRIIQAGNLAQGAPILVITGKQNDLSAVHEVKKYGAAGFIDKSASPEDLLFRISRALSS
ncbi:MAG: response regulator [Nitrospirae bacterium]|nr:response regulator [Candidatus Manganitrophaceae bacterium]